MIFPAGIITYISKFVYNTRWDYVALITLASFACCLHINYFIKKNRLSNSIENKLNLVQVGVEEWQLPLRVEEEVPTGMFKLKLNFKNAHTYFPIFFEIISIRCTINNCTNTDEFEKLNGFFSTCFPESDTLFRLPQIKVPIQSNDRISLEHLDAFIEIKLKYGKTNKKYTNELYSKIKFKIRFVNLLTKNKIEDITHTPQHEPTIVGCELQEYKHS